MGVNDIFEAGKQGMNANRQALQVSSNNVANANTPGYSRQKAVFHAVGDSAPSGVRLSGVQIKEITRSHDEFVQNQILQETKLLHATRARSEGLRKIENLVHSDAYRVTDLVNKFFNDFRELSASPEVATLRNNISHSAKSTANGFRNLNNGLQELKGSLDKQLEAAVHDINTMIHELASLNESVSSFHARGENPLELHDRRELVLRELSKKLGFEIAPDEQDNANILLGGLGALVIGNQPNKLVVMHTPEEGEKAAGSLDIFVKQGDNYRKVTPFIKDGEIGGILHTRDNVINPTLKQLDRVAYKFTEAVNEIHREGVGADGVSGRNLFVPAEEVNNASALIDVNNRILESADGLAVGYEADSPGDNRVALKIAELQNTPLVLLDDPNLPFTSLENTTINDSLTNLVGGIAVQSSNEDRLVSNQQAIVDQLENYRQSISGVNLEEEAINLMQYQAVFNASAKSLKIGDELMQTILSIRP